MSDTIRVLKGLLENLSRIREDIQTLDIQAQEIIYSIPEKLSTTVEHKERKLERLACLGNLKVILDLEKDILSNFDEETKVLLKEVLISSTPEEGALDFLDLISIQDIENIFETIRIVNSSLLSVLQQTEKDEIFILLSKVVFYSFLNSQLSVRPPLLPSNFANISEFLREKGIETIV